MEQAVWARGGAGVTWLLFASGLGFAWMAGYMYSRVLGLLGEPTTYLVATAIPATVWSLACFVWASRRSRAHRLARES